MTVVDRQVNNHRMELLAPAGSVKALEAGFMAGADAVYIGGDRFGARAYADNPGREDLIGAIDLAHRLGKKLYMTVNTLLKDEELENELTGWIRPYVEAGLDGVIVQDFGVFSMLRECFPELPLHASTQMAVTGPCGAALLKEAGAVRVVPARELSLSEIRRIRDEAGIEIEGFIHGAMCYSYSGMCLMSSLIGGRSGNRGRCAGVCRLAFDVADKERTLTGKNSRFPLNMKDMCTIGILPELISAGITSFKIEGRMKKPEYTAGVVSVYRKYLDLCEKRLDAGLPLLPADWYHVEAGDRQILWDIFNRDGFNEGCYRVRNGRELIALKNEKENQVTRKNAQELTEKIRSSLESREMRKRLQAPVKGRLSLSAGGMAVLSLAWTDGLGHEAFAEVHADGVQKAIRSAVTEERVRSQMNKTGESSFYFAELEIDMADDLFVPMQLLNDLRRRGMEELSVAVKAVFARTCGEQPAASQMSREILASVEDAEGMEDAAARSSDGAAGSMRLSVSVETREQLRAVLEKAVGGQEMDGRMSPADQPLAAVFVPWTFFEKTNAAHDPDLQRASACQIPVQLMLPYVCREADRKRLAGVIQNYRAYMQKEDGRFQKGAGILVRNLEELGLVRSLGAADQVILDAGVYTMNSRAEAFFAGLGIRKNTVSQELNAREIGQRDNRNSEMILYGRAPMMVSAHCLRKTLDRCTRRNDSLVLTDRKHAAFPVQCYCDFCYNVIYNSLPTSLLSESGSLKNAGIRSGRLVFTGEDPEMTGRILEAFLRENSGRSYEALPFQTTKGHYRRGAE